MRKRMIPLVVILAFCAASLLIPQSARAWACSVRPKKGTGQADLQAMTKVSKEAAQATALASFKPSAAPSVSEAELEVEQGCLVYSFDIRALGKKGVTEVIVDSGTGKVLSRQQESEAKEAEEKAGEKARPGGN